MSNAHRKRRNDKYMRKLNFLRVGRPRLRSKLFNSTIKNQKTNTIFSTADKTHLNSASQYFTVDNKRSDLNQSKIQFTF